jgi:hypothetical protein
VTAVEPEPRLRQIAAAARTAPVPVTVTDGLASALPAADASFDAAVVTFVLCTVPRPGCGPAGDPSRAQARRPAVHPGHVRADTAGLARIQHAFGATVWPRLFGGCHLGRDTAAAIERPGSPSADSTVSCSLRPAPPGSFHITGQAARPAGAKPA